MGKQAADRETADDGGNRAETPRHTYGTPGSPDVPPASPQRAIAVCGLIFDLGRVATLIGEDARFSSNGRTFAMQTLRDAAYVIGQMQARLRTLEDQHHD